MSADPTERWLQDANKMKKILLILYLRQVSWIVLNEKKKLKNSHLRSQRKRLRNLIIESFFVKVRCHVQKLLSFNVNKEICNRISFFFYVTYTSIAIFLALWKIYDFFFLLKMQTNRVNSRCLSNVTLS